MTAADWHSIDTPCGYAVPLQWWPAGDSSPVVLIMAALGAPARLYENLAAALAAQGVNVALLEQRGHGESSLRASRHSDWGFVEVLSNDLPAVFDWIEARVPGAPLYLLGHSLGGHYSAMMAGLHPQRISGVILVATGSPWWRAFDGKFRFQIRLLVNLLPLITALVGYYPGKQVGFGDREARTLMADWRDLAIDNTYVARGLREKPDARIARFTGPVLSVRLADDPFAPERAMRAVTDKFEHSLVTEKVVDAQALGDRADHFRWARQGTTVALLVADWLVGGRRDLS